MDERLTLIESMVKPCETAADIGTDHGFLICALAQNRVCKKGIAADINEKPLNKARQLIARQELCDVVKTVCTDGLMGIDLVDAVIIAGMGGELIAHIIDCWEYGRAGKTRFYLQPMTRPESLREYLFTHGYTILTERCCVANDRAYSVIEAVYNGEKIDYEPVDLYLGKIKPSDGESERTYCRRICSRIKRKADGLAESRTKTEQQGYWQKLLSELERKCSYEGTAGI